MASNAFNVADYALREEPRGLVLRPTLWHALAFRLLFGTGAMALLLLGIVGLDYELGKMERQRLVSPEELNVLKENQQPQIKKLQAAGRNEEAAQIQQEVDAMNAGYVKKHEEEYAAMVEGNRPWHMVLQGMGAICLFYALYFPLSPLWQRVRVTLEGEELVVRKNFFPKTRRISREAIAGAYLKPVVERAMDDGAGYAVSTYWQIVFVEGEKTLLLYLAVGPAVPEAPPARATAFVDALGRLAAADAGSARVET